MLERRERHEEHRHHHSEHHRPQRESAPETGCMNVVGVDADGMQAERRDRDGRDMPQIQRHRTRVAPGDDVPDPRPLCPASDRCGADHEQAGHPRALQGEHQRRRRHVGEVLGAGHHQSHLVGSRRDQHHLRHERRHRGGQRRTGADELARVGHPDHHRDKPDDHEVRDTGLRCPDRHPHGIEDPGQCQQPEDQQHRGPARAHPGQHRHERQHHQIDPQEPQQRNTFASQSCRRLRTEGHPRHQQGDGPHRQVPEHRTAQPLRSGQQPRTPRCAVMPAVGTRGATGQEEQRHDLHDPGDGLQGRQCAEQVADLYAVAVDGRQQQRAVSEHHHHERGEPGDVDGTIAAGRRAVGHRAGVGQRCGHCHAPSLPDRRR